MEPTLDEVRSELAEIYEELLTLPADDFKRRAELKERQNELRQLSRDLIEGAYKQPDHLLLVLSPDKTVDLFGGKKTMPGQED